MRKFNHIAKLVRINRHKLGLSQNDIAKMIGFASSGQFVSNVERGLCSIPFRKVKTAAAVLGIEPSEVIDAIVEDERDFMNEIVNNSEVAVMTVKEYRQKRIQEKERKRCQKILKQTSHASSATEQPKAEIVSTIYTAEKPIQNTPIESGILSPLVKDAINAFFTQNL